MQPLGHIKIFFVLLQLLFLFSVDKSNNSTTVKEALLLALTLHPLPPYSDNSDTQSPHPHLSLQLSVFLFFPIKLIFIMPAHPDASFSQLAGPAASYLDQKYSILLITSYNLFFLSTPESGADRHSKIRPTWTFTSFLIIAFPIPFHHHFYHSKLS